MWILYLCFFLPNGAMTEVKPINTFATQTACDIARYEIIIDSDVQSVLINENCWVLCVKK